jgi:hypothetical protein
MNWNQSLFRRSHSFIASALSTKNSVHELFRPGYLIDSTFQRFGRIGVLITLYFMIWNNEFSNRLQNKIPTVKPIYRYFTQFRGKQIYLQIFPDPFDSKILFTFFPVYSDRKRDCFIFAQFTKEIVSVFI